MPDLIAIAEGHLAIQFELAGIAVDEAADAQEAEETLARHLESEAGVVIVQETFAEGFSEAMRDRLARRRDLPLVVYCPLFDKEDSAVDAYVAEVVRPAVGYEIRLE
ncbi:MAG: hypothetical protein JXR94_12585 [Candidatus Hydrogenedentes bacterium]|nr:hypothetical protein [Candidatus Hydrogenedentota bacterium]